MIYLDANATSALRASAREAVARVLSSNAANPSSVHAPGRKAKALVSESRENMKRFLGDGGSALDCQIFFTSGGTEACNSLIHGFVDCGAKHIITSALEHPAILSPLEDLEKEGVSVSLIMPNRDGSVLPEAVCSKLRRETALVCIMAANNETGAMQPVPEIAQTLRAQGYTGPIVCDATQALGKSGISVSKLFASGINAIALSGHKLGALPGIGAVVFPGSASVCFPFRPLLRGGPQEAGYRGGSENLLGIVSLGAVAKELIELGASERSRVTMLREMLWERIALECPDVSRITPEKDHALTNTLLVHTPGMRGDDLVVALDLRGICTSTGSACASGKQQISHVVRALGFEGAQGREFVRFSLDWNTTAEEIEHTASVFSELYSLSVVLQEARA